MPSPHLSIVGPGVGSSKSPRPASYEVERMLPHLVGLKEETPQEAHSPCSADMKASTAGRGLRLDNPTCSNWLELTATAWLILEAGRRGRIG